MADDLGASNERTALAWQRTALALMASAALMARLTYRELGEIALIVLSLALLLTFWIFVESWARYSHHAGIRLRARTRRGGRAPASLAAATVLITSIEMAALLLTR